MKKHTPEPWKTMDIRLYTCREYTADEDYLGEMQCDEIRSASRIDVATAMANATRIVACVNACRGIPTEALECQTKAQLTAKLIDAHRAMLDALQVIYRDPRIGVWLRQNTPKTLEQVKNAIAKAEAITGPKEEERDDPICANCGHPEVDHLREGRLGQCWNGSGFGNRCGCSEYEM